MGFSKRLQECKRRWCDPIKFEALGALRNEREISATPPILLYNATECYNAAGPKMIV